MELILFAKIPGVVATPSMPDAFNLLIAPGTLTENTVTLLWNTPCR